MKATGLAANVQKPHCPRCAGYEDRVMRRAPGEEIPESVRPCPEFDMSTRFREWAVLQMRGEVMGQLSAAGLDRMAVLRAAEPPQHDEQARSPS